VPDASTDLRELLQVATRRGEGLSAEEMVSRLSGVHDEDAVREALEDWLGKFAVKRDSDGRWYWESDTAL
jgi:hypothetical protein